MSVRQHRHLGVYGFCARDGYILLVRKSRGPYRDQLDLPGGKMEFGEQPEETLQREVCEETGLLVVAQTLWDVKSHLVRYKAQDGIIEDLYHVGIIFRMTVGNTTENRLKSEPDGEDSDGAHWVSLKSVRDEELTPFAQWAIWEAKDLL